MRTMVLFWMLSLSLIDCAQVSEIIYRNMVADNSSCRKHEVNRMKLASYTHRSQTNFGRKIGGDRTSKALRGDTHTHTLSYFACHRTSICFTANSPHSLTHRHTLTYLHLYYSPTDDTLSTIEMKMKRKTLLDSLSFTHLENFGRAAKIENSESSRRVPCQSVIILFSSATNVCA